jgi:transposase
VEATGVYWQPIWHVLEDACELFLVNARHVKQVPGRMTDVSDAAWLARLMEAGLLRASFVPPKQTQGAPGHLASWACVCPGQNESAGKRRSAKTRKGSKWLRGTLTECARAAGRGRGTYLADRYRRLARRRGDKKATLAIAHEILCACWHILSTGELYRQPAPGHTDEQTIERIRRRAAHQLQQQGYNVILEPLPKVA